MKRLHLPPARHVLKGLLARSLGAVILLATFAVAHPLPASATARQPLRPSEVIDGVFFVHTATSANTVSNWTDLDNVITNDNPNALVLVTPNWNPNGEGGVYDPHPLGVWYDVYAQKWAIFHEDGSPMLLGASFNVQARFDSDQMSNEFFHVATPFNSAGDWTDISSGWTDNHPNELLWVTSNFNRGEAGGVYDPHPLGVWYHSGHWAIFHQDLTPIPAWASYNVLAFPDKTAGGVFLHTATAANSALDYTCLDDPSTNDIPNAKVYVTANWNPGGVGGVYDNAVLGVYYNGDQWCIFHEDGSAVPLGAAYNVFEF